jgi:PAS domain S-box-containing protein
MASTDLTGQRVAIYARSRPQGPCRSSIDIQVRRCREFAHANGGEVPADLVFSDHAASGADIERPAYERLMRLATARPPKVEVILVDNLSRLARAKGELFTIQRLLELSEVRLVAVSDGTETQLAQAEAPADTSASLEEWDAQALLSSLVDKLTAMVAYWDSSLRCRFANRAYETWFGVSSASMIGRDMKEFLGPLFALNYPYIEGALRGEPQEFERAIPDPAGGPPRYSQTQYIPDIVDGTVRGFSVLVVDITQRKLAEDALARAKEAAEAANRELEAFSYSVAHELRAPLRGINGFARLLLDTYKDTLDADGQDWLNELVICSVKQGRLIDALLSLARLTRSEIRRQSIDLSAIARAHASRLAAAESGRRVDCVIAEGLRATLDPILVDSLVQNLFENAWKFTSKLELARIEFGRTERDGMDVFFVRDNGAGFDMAHAAKLFQPLQRLHTQDEFPGMGIGLATVQRIVQRHGGVIWAEGVVAGGAVLYFSFPP